MGSIKCGSSNVRIFIIMLKQPTGVQEISTPTSWSLKYLNNSKNLLVNNPSQIQMVVPKVESVEKPSAAQNKWYKCSSGPTGLENSEHIQNVDNS